MLPGRGKRVPSLCICHDRQPKAEKQPLTSPETPWGKLATCTYLVSSFDGRIMKLISMEILDLTNMTHHLNSVDTDSGPGNRLRYAPTGNQLLEWLLFPGVGSRTRVATGTHLS